MLAVPADHIVREPHRLLEAIERAIPAALEGRLVTFGIEPSGPETGYGYIARGEERGTGIYEVASFVEKPHQARAEEMLSEGGHYWNAGIFLFSPRAMIEEFEQHAPEVLNVARASIPLASIDTVPLELDDAHYADAPDISIDYAVMERSDRVVVVPTDPGWNDVGAWSALWDLADKDDGGNAVVGDAMLRDTKNSFVMSRGDRLVAVHGLDDVVVVDTEDAVLVTSRHKVQGIKDIVTSLLSSARVEASTPKKVDRPWGSYQGIALGGGYQVKHITVKPGGRLSLQYHHHRSEHWTVVSGTAEVTIGNEVKFVQPNESVYVPLGVMHRMENPGKVDLHLIEVQCGDYVGEDDIVRVEDIYGRVKLG
jgi:mannose-1-phosphate guanylyltransferase/mannose-6-phosphate isomerase